MFKLKNLLPFIPVALFSALFNCLTWLGNGRLFERDSYAYIAVAKRLAGLAPLPDFALTAAGKPPLLAMSLAALAKRGCEVETAGMVLAQVAAILALLAVYLLALKLFGKAPDAFAAALTAACVPGVYEYGIQILRDPFYWAIATWAVLFTVYSLAARRRWRKLACIGAALGLTGLSLGYRYEGVELAIGVAAAALATLFPRRRGVAARTVLAAAFAALAFAATCATWENLADFLAALADTAFYPVVILGVPALLLPAERDRDAQLTNFVKAFVFFMVAWRLAATANMITGRYLLPPVIVFAALLPRGFHFFASLLERRFDLPRRVGTALLLAAIVGTTVLKECRHWGDGKGYLHAAARRLSTDRGDASAALFGVNSDCARLAAISGMDGKRVRDFDEAILEMAKSKSERKYLCTMTKADEPPEVFAAKFRRFFGIFPFDLTGEFGDRNHALRLWRFNGRTAFAGTELPEFELPVFHMVKWRAAQPEFKVSDLYPGLPAEVQFFFPKFSSVYGDRCRFTTLPEPELWRKNTALFRNRSLYPIAAEEFDLEVTRGEAESRLSATPVRRRAVPAELPTAATPLTLRFDRPLATAGTEVFAANFSQLGFLDATPTPAVVVEPRPPLPVAGKSVLLLTDPYSEEVGLGGELERRGAILTVAKLEDGLTGKWIAPPPEGEFELVVVFAGIHDVYKRPYDLCFAPERTRAAVADLLEKLRAAYPDAVVVVAPPFAPAAGACRINPNGNALLCWLYRFALCEAVYANFPEVALFSPSLDPAADYEKNGGDYFSPFALNRSGLRKFADDLLALCARLKETGK